MPLAFLPTTPLKPHKPLKPLKPPLPHPHNHPPKALLRYRLPSPLPKNAGAGSQTIFIKSVRHPANTLFTRLWDAHPATAGCVIIPGLVWHSGWYAAIARPLSHMGVRVVGVDGTGTGRSERLRGTPGLIFDVDDHADEIAAVVERLRKGLPTGAPVFVLAESSGGITACRLAMRERFVGDIKGWIMCAPALKIGEQVLPNQFVVALVKRLAKLFPTLPTPGQGISGVTWDAAFGDSVSHELSKKDPYVLYDVPLPLATCCAMLTALQQADEALEKGVLSMHNVLVLHNRSDVRTLYEGSDKFVSRVKGMARLVDPGGTAHHLFQDDPLVTGRVVREICSFVEQVRLSAEEDK